MSYLEMGFAFVTVAFVIGNFAVSLLGILLWRAARGSLRRSGPIFLIRMLPAIGSAALVLGFILPAFVSFEPRGTSERPGPMLVALALLAFALVAAGLLRGVKSFRQTRRLEQVWMTAAGRASFGAPGRAYRVPSPLPFAALVGIVRPRLFVADRFFDALADGERQAVLDHEAGHRRSLDNLKRTLMKLAPDFLSFSSDGREMERAWAIAAEEEADDFAAGPDRAHSLDLAGALLKASRSMPISCAPASSFCESATIARRVERLLHDTPSSRGPARRPTVRIAWMIFAVATAAVLLGPALRASYAMTEAAVRMLQ